MHLYVFQRWVMAVADGCDVMRCQVSVQDVIAEVLQKKDEALHRMVTSAWPRVPSSSHAQLQMFLGMLTDICRHKVLYPSVL